MKYFKACTIWQHFPYRKTIGDSKSVLILDFLICPLVSQSFCLEFWAVVSWGNLFSLNVLKISHYRDYRDHCFVSFRSYHFRMLTNLFSAKVVSNFIPTVKRTDEFTAKQYVEKFPASPYLTKSFFPWDRKESEFHRRPSIAQLWNKSTIEGKRSNRIRIAITSKD